MTHNMAHAHTDHSPPVEPIATHPLMLTGAECQVILLIRSIHFGSVDVQVQHGHPVFVNKVLEKIKLA